MSEYAGYGSLSFTADYILHEGKNQIGGIEFDVIKTPGHTQGSVCLLFGNMLFSGDTLFRRSVGRTDFVKSSTSDLLESINKKLFNLPGDVRVYPGHMGETSIGFEKRYNPYVY
jgi:glyoxylase-like metal-dependent hydrolase (beta-lactamase superfamily II)